MYYEEDGEYYAIPVNVVGVAFKDCCMHNMNISCPKNDRKPGACNKCGWNPAVAIRRMQKTRKELHGTN